MKSTVLTLSKKELKRTDCYIYLILKVSTSSDGNSFDTELKLEVKNYVIIDNIFRIPFPSTEI